MAKFYDECHTYGAILHPLASDGLIQPTFDASVVRGSMRFRFQFALWRGATFVLLDRDFKVSLATGESLSLPIQRFPGGVASSIAIESGIPFTNSSRYWSDNIVLFADMKTSSYPKRIVLETPRFEINGVAYPSTAVPLHLESRSGLDVCEG